MSSIYFFFVNKTISIFPAYLKPNLSKIIVCENRRASKTFTTPRINITNQITRMWNLKQSRNSFKKNQTGCGYIEVTVIGKIIDIHGGNVSKIDILVLKNIFIKVFKITSKMSL